MASVYSPEFRVSYPNVFKPKKNELNGKEEYSLVALFKKGADLSKLKAEAERALIEKWGPDKTKWPRPLKTPFRDQGERKLVDKTTNEPKIDPVTGKPMLQAGHEEGAIFINLKSSERPGLVDQQAQRIIDPSQFYAGCYAVATVRAKAYDQKGNRGVSFWLQNLQKMNDGDPLSGRSTPEQDFAPVAQAATGGAAVGPGSATDLFG